MKTKQNGFIAITMVLILGALLLVLAQTLSTSSYFQSSHSLDFELKELSYFVALSCMDQARFELSKDIDYSGNVTVAVSTYTCTIAPITIDGSSNTLIRTSATTEGITTKLKMVLDVYLSPLSFQEE